jgi:hypothetical protein
MLSVFMLNVIILNVVAPFVTSLTFVCKVAATLEEHH